MCQHYFVVVYEYIGCAFNYIDIRPLGDSATVINSQAAIYARLLVQLHNVEFIFTVGLIMRNFWLLAYSTRSIAAVLCLVTLTVDL